MGKEKIVRPIKNSSVYKRGQKRLSSVKANFLHSSSVQVNLFALFVLTDDLSVCINVAKDELYFVYTCI